MYSPATFVSSAATIDPLVPHKPASGAIQIAAATIGNALEWFDILVYGYFATTIAGVFFPNSNSLVSLLLTFGSFGLSYVARPVGAIVLGAYADRAGRKAALTLSIRLMVIGTAIMAFMPSYSMIGVFAPIAVFIARLVQGFAVAGEFGSSTAFMIEHSVRRKAFFSSWQYSGQNIAKLLAALFGVGLLTTLSGPQLHAWGWRIPFFFGLLVGPVGMYIRRKVDETPEFLEAIPARSPVRDLFAHQKVSILLAAGIIAVGTANTYFAIYIPTFAITRLHLPPATGYIVTIVLAFMAALLCPVAGHIADRVGYVRIMLPAALLSLVSFYPILLFITRRPSMSTLLIGLAWDALLLVAFTSALSPMMADMFPAQVRASGLSLSYNLGVTLFGGFAPAIFTWLSAATHNNTAPSLYLMATAATSAVCVALANRRINHAARTVSSNN
jgi:MFS transporter, MHS family, proline/betaine transporter